jgi:hypothetical protein
VLYPLIWLLVLLGIAAQALGASEAQLWLVFLAPLAVIGLLCWLGRPAAKARVAATAVAPTVAAMGTSVAMVTQQAVDRRGSIDEPRAGSRTGLMIAAALLGTGVGGILLARRFTAWRGDHRQAIGQS